MFCLHAGGILKDDISLSAACYSEQQYLVLAVTKPAVSVAPVPVAVVTSPQAHHLSSMKKTLPLALDRVDQAAAVSKNTKQISVAKCAAGHICATFWYQNVRSKCGLCSACIENNRTGARCNACNFDVCHACAFKTLPPAINFATEWLDEDGDVCPKNVDYATQCPKGHALAPFFCSGGPQAQQPSDADDVICRVCHGSTQRQHACDWLVCSVAACCGGYAVCTACVTVLGSARGPAAARRDDFCMMVMPLACELKQCLASSLL